MPERFGDEVSRVLPQLRIDELLDELQARLGAVRSSRDRVAQLLEAVVGIGSGLDLEQALTGIVRGATGLVDAQYGALGVIGAQEKLTRVILMGDLNGTMNDRSLAPVTSQMRSAQGSAGSGFGFSWPAEFPMARIDQIMTRGVTPTDAWTLPRTGSDHLPIGAHIEL